MRRVIVVLFALSTLWCGTARADVYDDNPAAVSVGPGNVWVFARGADGNILSRHLSAGTWGDWTAVPGLDAGSGPGALVYGDTIMLFARGQDGAMWTNTLRNGAWVGWISLAGGFTSAPAAGMPIGTTTAYVAARGLDNRLYYKTFASATGWSTSWPAPGGNSASAPTVSGFTSEGTLDIFYRDVSGQAAQFYWKSNAWNGPTLYGGGLRGAPAAVSPQVDWLDVFARGVDDGLWVYHHYPTAAPWRRVDATAISSAPAATSDATGRELIFARTADGLSMLTITGANTTTPTAGAWQLLGPIAVPAPPPVIAPINAPPPTTNPTVLVTLTPLLSYNFKSVTKKSTRFATLSVKNVPAGATVKVSCARGCTAKSLTKTNAPRTVSLTKFIKRAWKVGTTLTVIVTKPGTIASVKTLKIRAKKVPLLTSRCLPPGATKPAACSAG